MFIDAHSHLDGYAELESVLTEISEHRIFTISNAVDPASYQRNLAIADRCDLVLPTFGIHPWTAPQYVDHLEDMQELIDQSPMIGEIGLDYHWVEDTVQYPAQRRVFEFLLATASQQGKTVNIHTKGAEKEILGLLQHYGIQRSIIHWYSGPLDILQEMVAHGCYFTVGVEVLTSPYIQNIVRDLPAELLLTETDNPGGYEWLMGTGGRPHHIIDVVQKLAEVRQVAVETITETVEDNFRRLVRGDTWLQASCGYIFGLDD